MIFGRFRVLICLTHGFEHCPIGMITEYHENGDLHGFLQKSGHLLSGAQLARLAGQVCAGMLELSRHSIVHRDLAARNVMPKMDQNQPKT